jgi:hypothetical protein
VAHTCNPNNSGGRDHKDPDVRLAWAKSYLYPISINKLGKVVYSCNPSCVRDINRRTEVQAGLGKKIRDHI